MPRDAVPKHDRKPVAVAILVGALVSLGVFGIVRDRDRRTFEAGFATDASSIASSVREALKECSLEIEAIAAFFAATDDVSRAEFQTFVRPLLARNPGIQALEWVPRTLGVRRTAFEAAVRREGFPAFRIVERDPGGRLRPAEARTEHFPVAYVEPFAPNAVVLGYDLASDPVHLAALESARDSEAVTATAPIRLVQDPAGKGGFLAVRPIFRENAFPGAVEARRSRLEGFALAVFRAGTLMDWAVGPLGSAGLDLFLFDLSAPTGGRLMDFRPASGKRPAAPAAGDDPAVLKKSLNYEETIAFGGRSYLVLLRPSSAYLAARRTWAPWGILSAGLLITLVLAFLVNDRVGREKELASTKERLEFILGSSPTVIYTSRASGDYGGTYVSPNVTRWFGYEPREFTEDPEFWVRHIHPDDASRVLSEFPRLLEKGQHVSEYRFRAKDGGYRWTHDEAKLVRDARGDAEEIVGCWRDITEQKNLEEERTKLIALVENSPDIVGLASLDQEVFYLNGGGLKAFEFGGIEEARGTRIPDYFGGEEGPRLREMSRSLAEKGSWFGQSRFRRRKSGALFPVEINAFVVRENGTGKPLALATVSRDISARVAGEERVLKSLRLETALRGIERMILEGADVRETLESACAAVVALGYRMCWVALSEPDRSVSPAAAAGFLDGYLEAIRVRWDLSREGSGPTGTAIRTGRARISREIESDPAFEPWRQEALKRGYRSSVALPMATPESGVIGALNVYSDRAGDFAPEALRFLENFAQQCTIALVSARRLAELREAVRRLRFHVANMPLGHIVWDAEMRAAEWNPAAERIFGWSAAEALGKRPDELVVAPGDWGRIDELRERIRDSREPVPANYPCARKDGEPIVCQWYNTPLKDPSGKDAGVLSMVQDVTEKRRLERQLEAAQRMEAVGTLAGGVAHDFNNALTGIFGFAEVMREKIADNPTAVADLAQIMRSAERAANLTRQLLAFARRQVIEPVHLDVNAVVSDLLKLLGQVLGEHIEVATRLSEGLPAVFADHGQIEQVLMNLCLNSRDAMPEGGRLRIETEAAEPGPETLRRNPGAKAGRYVVIRVSDTGTGMDEKTRERVFEPFFTTKGHDRGTGLGLAVSYGIVKQHNGFIELESEVGKGTTFAIHLPASKGTPHERIVSRQEPVSRGRETILLAEDEAAVRELGEMTLREFGYDVVPARDGEEAVAIFQDRKAPIALAILDVVMPRMGGRDAYEEMRKADPALKVLFVSGYAEDLIHESFVLAPGVPFLPKPFGPSALARKVREVLDR